MKKNISDGLSCSISDSWREQMRNLAELHGGVLPRQYWSHTEASNYFNSAAKTFGVSTFGNLSTEDRRLHNGRRYALNDDD
jgi:hypothetical protein